MSWAIDGAEAVQWIMDNGSGTLRRAVEEKMVWTDLYFHERLAFEVATAACMVEPKDLVMTSPKAQSDSPSTTETCWYARVLRHRWSSTSFGGVGIKVIAFNHINSATKPYSWPSDSGVGISLVDLTLPWLPPNYTVLLPTSFWVEGHGWTPVENPL